MSGHRLVVSVNISETRKIAVFGASPDRGTHHHFSLQNRCYVAKNVLIFLKRPLSGCKYYIVASQASEQAVPRRKMGSNPVSGRFDQLH